MLSYLWLKLTIHLTLEVKKVLMRHFTNFKAMRKKRRLHSFDGSFYDGVEVLHTHEYVTVFIRKVFVENKI